MDNNDFFENQLFAITTIIETHVTKNGTSYSMQGSGFYYNEVSPSDPSMVDPQWYNINKYWLVTNRHLVLPRIDGEECLPDEFVFNLRENINGQIIWKPYILTKDKLLLSLKLHKQDAIDVALVDISIYIHEMVKETVSNGSKKNIYFPTTLSNINLPDKQPISIDVTSDIIILSYPKGFYDTHNKFPIVKSGIVASAWGANFNGLPVFQIDTQLFPGSSGGLVISKPINIAFIGGTLKISQTKQFVLLGVYSGEFKWYEDIDIGGTKYKMGNSYGLGNVWYSYLIPQIMNEGINL